MAAALRRSKGHPVTRASSRRYCCRSAPSSRGTRNRCCHGEGGVVFQPCEPWRKPPWLSRCNPNHEQPDLPLKPALLRAGGGRENHRGLFEPQFSEGFVMGALKFTLLHNMLMQTFTKHNWHLPKRLRPRTSLILHPHPKYLFRS